MKKIFLLVITGIGIAMLIWCCSVVIQCREALSWSQTKGKMISSSLSVNYWPKYLEFDSAPARWYGARVQYQYTVGNQTYISHRLSVQDEDFRSPKEALRLMNKYRRHHEVTVFYDPHDPKEAMLEPWDIGDLFIPFLIGGVMTFLGLFFIWEQAVEVNYKGIYSHIQQGIIYQSQGKHEAAWGEYNQAVKKDPYTPLAYISRGNFYLQEKRWEEALIDFKQALSIEPKNGSVYVYLANAYIGKGEYDQALINAQKATAMGFYVKPEILEDINKNLAE